MNRTVRIALVLVLALLAVFAWWYLRSPDEVDGEIRASGTVEATESRLGFQMAGRIQSVEVREGDHVAEGAVLARLDRRELEAQVASLEAAVDQARARLAELEKGARPQEVARAEAAVRAARERVQDLRRDADRARRLFEGGAVSRESMEKAETAVQVAEATLEEALEGLDLVREGPRSEQIDAHRAGLRQTEATRARARARLDDAVIIAPMDAVVALRHREPGESAAPGGTVVTLRDLEDRWVRIFVAGDVIGRVHLGQRARIRGDTHPDRVYSGEVFFIGSEAEFTPRNVQTAEERVRLVYPVRVRITDDPEVDLKPGLPVDVVLLAAEAEDS